MTLDEVYHQSLKRLKNPQLEEINIRMLLCDINSIESMSSFYIRKDEEIQDLQRFNELFERFLKGEPIQYLLKKAQFYGRDFYVDNLVLIPRMESEEVVLFAINKAKPIFSSHFKPIIADVCALLVGILAGYLLCYFSQKEKPDKPKALPTTNAIALPFNEQTVEKENNAINDQNH